MNSSVSTPPTPANSGNVAVQYAYKTGGGSPGSMQFTADTDTVGNITSLIFSAFCSNQSNIHPFLKNALPGIAFRLIGPDNKFNFFQLVSVTPGTATQPVTFGVSVLKSNSSLLIDGAKYLLQDVVSMPLMFVPATMPTSDPHVVGQVWSNLGLMTISAGP